MAYDGGCLGRECSKLCSKAMQSFTPHLHFSGPVAATTAAGDGSHTTAEPQRFSFSNLPFCFRMAPIWYSPLVVCVVAISFNHCCIMTALWSLSMSLIGRGECKYMVGWLHKEGCVPSAQNDLTYQHSRSCVLTVVLID